jgi:hypothetical protein
MSSHRHCSVLEILFYSQKSGLKERSIANLWLRNRASGIPPEHHSSPAAYCGPLSLFENSGM